MATATHNIASKSGASKSGASKTNKKTSTRKKRKATDVKVSKANSKPVDKPILGASFTRLRPITITTGWLTKVTIVGDGVIELTDSWTDFILTLFCIVYENNRNKFMKVLADHNVLSDGVNVNHRYVEYAETSNIKCEVYKLKDSIYYIEFRRDGADYIKAIRGLLGILKVDIKDVTFDIDPLKIEVEGLNTTYSNVKQKVISETLANLIYKGKFDINITAITVFGYKQKVKSTSQALILFMTWAIESYGKTLEDAGVKNSITGVGMTTAAHIDEYAEGFTTAKVGDYYLYCCEDNMSIMKYLKSVTEHIGISHELIELEYKTLELVN